MASDSCLQARGLRAWRTWILVAVTLCLLAALLAHAYIGSFSRMMADTYCHAARVKAEGLLGAQRTWYASWTGRFFSTFAEDAVGLIGPRVLPVLPALALMLWLSALTWTLFEMRLAPSSAAAWLVATALAALIVFVSLDSIPAVDQSLYWSAGMHNCIPPLVFLTAFAGMVCWRVDRSLRRVGGALCLALGATLTFLAAGANEMFGAMQVSVLAMALGVGRFTGTAKFRRSALPVVAAGLLGAVVGIVTLILAPGNKVRQAAMPSPPDLLLLLQIALAQAWQFVVQTLSRAPANSLGALVWPALLGAGLLPTEAPMPRPWRGMVRALMWIPIGGFILLLASYSAAAYALSGPPPGRSLLIPQYVLTCTVVAWAFVLGRAARQAGLTRILGRDVTVWKAVAGLSVALLALHALVAAQHTLAKRQEFAAYADAWDDMDRTIRAAKANGAGRIALPPLENPDHCGEIGPDPGYFVNSCASDYYGVILLTHAVPPAPTDMAGMTPLDARIHNVAQVLGYAVDRAVVGPGGKLAVTVYWRPQNATEQPYTVFVHLLDPASNIIAQSDSQPLQAQYPTTSWVYGYAFADTYELTLPDRLPVACDARLVLGLYDLQTMERLPVAGRDTDDITHRVRLGAIAVSP